MEKGKVSDITMQVVVLKKKIYLGIFRYGNSEASAFALLDVFHYQQQLVGHQEGTVIGHCYSMPKVNVPFTIDIFTVPSMLACTNFIFFLSFSTDTRCHFITFHDSSHQEILLIFIHLFQIYKPHKMMLNNFSLYFQEIH